MTLVLKSNVKLKTNGLLGKIKQQPVLSADFVGETYMANGKKVSINDVVSVTNNRYVKKSDVFGNQTEVRPVGVPVIGSDPQSLAKGLQIENPQMNYFENSLQPASFSKSMELFKNRAVYLKIVGDGSATLSVNGTVIGTATANNDLVYQSEKDDRSATVSVDVTGSPTFGALYNTVDKRLPFGHYKTGLEATPDKASIPLDALQKQEGCIVVKSYMPEGAFDPSLTKLQSYLLLQVLDSSSISQAKGVTVGFREGQQNVFLARGYSTKETLLEVPFTLDNKIKQTNITAVSFKDSTATVAVNGLIVATLDITSVNIDTIFIGSGYWGVITTQLLESYALYDRVLTEQELIVITSV